MRTMRLFRFEVFDAIRGHNRQVTIPATDQQDAYRRVRRQHGGMFIDAECTEVDEDEVKK